MEMLQQDGRFDGDAGQHKYPQFARVPGWIIKSGLFARLSFKACVLVTVLYGYASKEQRKAWPKVATLCCLTGISRTHVWLAKRELAREGLLCFTRVHQEHPRHPMWMAGERPFDFAVNTEGPEFAAYRRQLTRTQKVAAPRHKGLPDASTNGHRQHPPFVDTSPTSDEASSAQRTEKRT